MKINPRSVLFNSSLMLCLVLAVWSAGAEEQAVVERAPAVLFVHGQYDPADMLDKVVFQRLRKAGFEVGLCEASDLTYGTAKHFNVMVLLGFPWTDNYVINRAEFDRFKKIISDFTVVGGGLFINLSGGESAGGVLPALEFMKPLGCVPLLQTVNDPGTRVLGTIRNFAFGYTEAITPSPITEGVNSLWYPMGGEKACGPFLWPFRVDASWTVVAKGGPDSRTEPRTSGIPSVDAMLDHNLLVGNVPLVAIREDKGTRLVVSGIYPSFIWSAGFEDALQGVFVKEGLKGKPSQGWLLHLNALRWLAAPSLKSGALGGKLTSQDVVDRVMKTLPEVKRVDWGTLEIRPERPLAKGLMGARSLFSTGSNSVAEMAKAAKEEGLDFLVFAEDYARLKKKDAGELTKACQAAADGSFTAMPGFIIGDEADNSWFYMKSPLPFPTPEMLTPDGSKYLLFISKPDCARPLQFWLNFMRFTGGASLLHNRGQMSYWDFRAYSAVALYTYEKGKLVDNLSREYPTLQQNALNLAPISVSLVNSVEELKRAVKENDPLTYVTAAAGTNVLKLLNNLGGYCEEPHTFVSSGPVFRQWRVVKGEQHYVANGDFFRPDLYRYDIGLRVTSDVGIREVRIVDGGRPFRRFLGNGAKEMKLELPLVHDRQHHLVVYATDVKGDTAISGEIWDRNLLMQDVNCSDRVNSTIYGMLRTPEGGAAQWGSQIGTGRGPYESEMAPWDYGLPGQDPSAGFDGAASNGAVLCHYPWMESEPKWDVALNSRDMMIVSSADLLSRELQVTRKYREGRQSVWNHWHTILPTVATTCFDLVDRKTWIAPALDARANLVLEEFTLTFKTAITVAEGSEACLAIGALDRRQAKNVIISGSDGVKAQWENVADKSQPLKGAFGPGSYVCGYDTPQGTVTFYSLTPGLEWSTDAQAQRIKLSLVLPKRKFEPGEKLSWTIAMSTGRLKDRTPAIAEEMRAKFGLGMEGTAKLVLTWGKLEGIRGGSARIEEREGGVDGSLKDDQLPTNLPVRLAGMNERWTAVYCDTEKKVSRPIAVLEGEARFNLPREGVKSFFAGHPFVCDMTEAVLTAVDMGGGKWLLDVHNPTDRAAKIQVKTCPAFPLGKLAPFTMEVAAGASISKEITLECKGIP